MELKELISNIIRDAEHSQYVSERVTSYTNYDSRYVFPKSTVIVKVELKSGKTLSIDVTDYFEKEIK